MAHTSNGNGTAGPGQAAPRAVLEVARALRGPNEATNLANCLLGLLLLTPDAMLARLPETPLGRLKGWGISSRTLRQNGRNARRPRTLRQLVRSLKAAAGQVTLTTRGEPPLSPRRSGRSNRPRSGQSERAAGGRSGALETVLEFRDVRGVHAVIAAGDLRKFVERLATCLGGDDIDAGRARFVASFTQRPYHLQSCKWVRRISRRNLRGVRNRRSALKSGHRPCKVCKP